MLLVDRLLRLALLLVALLRDYLRYQERHAKQARHDECKPDPGDPENPHTD